jgi:hypothetical protein
MKRFLLCVLLFTARAGSPPAVHGADPGFSEWWHDGRAELDGYQWTGSRYGELRSGYGVAIFVTEPMSASKLVKVNDASRHPGDVVDVLKLNLVRDFQTGIYDYNTMVSTFARTSDFSPVKISFSSSEWCGNVYTELLFRDRKIELETRSYFEDESGNRTLPFMKAGVAEDELPILLRGLRAEFLPPGEERAMPFLPGTFWSRLQHRPLNWAEARIRRQAETEAVTVPAGTFEAVVYVVDTNLGRSGRYWIATEYPHVLVRWEWKVEGGALLEAAELAGSDRLKYWELNGNGGEAYLKRLGLVPLPSP